MGMNPSRLSKPRVRLAIEVDESADRDWGDAGAGRDDCATSAVEESEAETARAKIDRRRIGRTAVARVRLGRSSYGRRLNPTYAVSGPVAAQLGTALHAMPGRELIGTDGG